MKKRVFRIVGFAFIFVGIFILIISRGGITGFVSFFGDEGETSVWGIVFVLIGLVLVFVGREESRLGEIVESNEFRKDIKRQDPQEIRRAIGKIGSGLGKAHSLSGGAYAIKTSKGGRIIYHRAQSGAIILDRYTPNHEYRRIV